MAKSMREIKEALRIAADALEAASTKLDEVERDGKELADIREQATSLVIAIDQAIHFNQSNVDEVRAIKSAVEDAYLALLLPKELSKK